MPITGSIKQLYTDESKTQALFPVTSFNAVFDSEGTVLQDELDGKQETLVSGSNIKTINGNSILGSGNIVACPLQYDEIFSITYNLTNWTCTPQPKFVTQGTTSLVIAPVSGAEFYSDPTVTGATGTWDSSTNTLTISSITGNITITASATIWDTNPGTLAQATADGFTMTEVS